MPAPGEAVDDWGCTVPSSGASVVVVDGSQVLDPDASAAKARPTLAGFHVPASLVHTRSLSWPQPVPRVHSRATSFAVHRRAPTLVQNSSAWPNVIPWMQSIAVDENLSLSVHGQSVFR